MTDVVVLLHGLGGDSDYFWSADVPRAAGRRGRARQHPTSQRWPEGSAEPRPAPSRAPVPSWTWSSTSAGRKKYAPSSLHTALVRP